MNYTKSWLHKLRIALVSTKAKSSKSDVSDTLGEINAIRQLETQVCELLFHCIILIIHIIHSCVIIVILLQRLFKVSKIQKGVQIFLNDMEEAGNLDQEARNLLAEIQDQTNEIFDSWSRNILAGIRDESLR